MIVIGERKIKIGIALSGGGYRAAAFHLGVFRKLKQLRILDKLDVISTISGGSIAGAYYLLNKDDFDKFEISFTSNLQKSVVKRIIFHWRFLTPIFLFLGISWILFYDPFKFEFSKKITILSFAFIFIIGVLFQFKILSFSQLKIKAYKKIFFKDLKISDLPDSPAIALNATNLSTGTLWTFSKNKTSDSSYEYPKDGGNSIKFNCSDMPIAIAVASSTSVPVPFDPILIDKKYYENLNDFNRIKPRLIDGGLYDNQGIHKISQPNSSYSCDIILVSDGSQPFNNLFKSSNTFFILYRGIDVMMRKIKNLQFIRDVYSANREIAYFSLDWKYNLCVEEFIRAARKGQVFPAVLSYHGLTDQILKKPTSEIVSFINNKINYMGIIEKGLSNEEISKVSKIGTNLTALKKTEIDLLSRHAETLTDLQINLYCPTLTNNIKK